VTSRGKHDQFPPSSIIRAAAPGETGSRASPTIQSCRAHPLRAAVRFGSCTNAFLRRGVPLPDSLRRSRPGRAIVLFPLVARRRSWGSSLRRFTPAGGWQTHFCAAGPTCRSFPCHPPRFIFVEVTRPPVRNAMSEERKGDKVWDDPGSASGLHLPSAIRFATQRALRIDPALGFASFRVVGTRLVHSEGLDPIRIIGPRAPITRHPIRSWVFGVGWIEQTVGCRQFPFDRGSDFPPATSPTLQRFKEADALPIRSTPVEPAPCLRFCTFREKR